MVDSSRPLRLRFAPDPFTLHELYISQLEMLFRRKSIVPAKLKQANVTTLRDEVYKRDDQWFTLPMQLLTVFDAWHGLHHTSILLASIMYKAHEHNLIIHPKFSRVRLETLRKWLDLPEELANYPDTTLLVQAKPKFLFA